MKPLILALAFVAAAGVAAAQTGPGAGNPPTGWSGGATPPSSDTGKTHPDGKAPADARTAPPPQTAPTSPQAGAIKTEGEARKAIESEGFTRVTALKKDPDGAWSGRAIRGTSNVAVRIDARGNISAE
jgi:hypothetical protein